MIARVFALTLCAAVVCALPAFAAEEETAAPEAPAYRSRPGVGCRHTAGKWRRPAEEFQ